jgi:hypothetical protein
VTEDTTSEETAFLIVRRQNGTFYATPNLDETITVDRVANRQDMKHGCRDILDIINYVDEAGVTAEVILDLLRPPAEETVAGSIREALDERGIL